MVVVLACASESDRAGSENSLSDRVAQLLARIDCRRADSGEERERVLRLRYQAYLREGAISQIRPGRFPTRMTRRPMPISSGCISTTS